MNLEELPNQNLMLILTKMVQDQADKSGPSAGCNWVSTEGAQRLAASMKCILATLTHMWDSVPYNSK